MKKLFTCHSLKVNSSRFVFIERAQNWLGSKAQPAPEQKLPLTSTLKQKVADLKREQATLLKDAQTADKAVSSGRSIEGRTKRAEAEKAAGIISRLEGQLKTIENRERPLQGLKEQKKAMELKKAGMEAERDKLLLEAKTADADSGDRLSIEGRDKRTKAQAIDQKIKGLEQPLATLTRQIAEEDRSLSALVDTLIKGDVTTSVAMDNLTRVSALPTAPATPQKQSSDNPELDYALHELALAKDAVEQGEKGAEDRFADAQAKVDVLTYGIGGAVGPAQGLPADGMATGSVRGGLSWDAPNKDPKKALEQKELSADQKWTKTMNFLGTKGIGGYGLNKFLVAKTFLREGSGGKAAVVEAIKHMQTNLRVTPDGMLGPVTFKRMESTFSTEEMALLKSNLDTSDLKVVEPENVPDAPRLNEKVNPNGVFILRENDGTLYKGEGVYLLSRNNVTANIVDQTGVRLQVATGNLRACPAGASRDMWTAKFQKLADKAWGEYRTAQVGKALGSQDKPRSGV